MSDPPGNHQNLQAFPRLASPFVDLETGAITAPWYRLLIGIWQRLGGSSNSFPASVFGQQTAGGTTIELFNAQTGEPLGFFSPDVIPQDFPADVQVNLADDARLALALAIPADSTDGDQIVLASLARAVPADA